MQTAHGVFEMRESGTTMDLLAVSGTQPHGEHVYIVGREGTVLHYNAYVMTAIDVGTRADLYGVWVESLSAIYVVGAGGKILTWDGVEWTIEEPTTVDLRDVHGGGAGVFAVGDEGTVLRREAGAWRRSPSGTTATLHGVWVGDSRAFAVGDGGTILELR